MLARWKSPDFATFFSRCLAESPWPAFFWETPALTADDMDSPFECVTVTSPALAATRADIGPFESKLAKLGPDHRVGAFPNLNGDAVLIVPGDTQPTTNYAHLGAFVRTADASQMLELWSLLATTVVENLTADRKLWISTSGLGVAWLHLRIDTHPKYYSYEPYRREMPLRWPEG